MDKLTYLHNEILQAVAKEELSFPGLELTTFFPVQGQASTGELMVVGRAVNGWSESKWTATDAADPARRAQIIREVVATSTKTDCCPMAWVTDRWCHGIKGKWEARRSAFFRLSRAVSQSLLGSSEQWASRLIFSNLYKVAPYQGRNPSDKLCRVQQLPCEAHLLEEIEFWKPKRILFITGWNWAQPFVERLWEVSGEREQNGVDWSGTAKTRTDGQRIQVVVCTRPERQKQAPLVDAILHAFTAS